MSLSRLLPLRLCALLFILVGVPASAHAAVVVTVDKSTQRMSVAVDGTPRHNWAVSTGRAGYGTPSGTYAPTRLERTWFSRAYYNSPMPHSIFFHGGYAIHGSYEISRLGGPASHGCIRLHPSNAATLFSLVRRYGAGNTRIIVTEGDFGSARRAASPDPRAYSPYQPRYQRDYAPHAYPGPSFPFYRY
ncbi:MAG: L,D-transpeptidase [Rhodoplanes sp.]|jgi:L,D-transpeptidase catalytic domain